MRFSESAKRRGVLLLIALAGIFLAGAVLRTSVAHAASAFSQEGFYQQTNLVSDVAGMAPVTDPNLKNPWGLAASSTGPWWVSNNNAGNSTLYTGAGAIVPLVVNTPLPGGKPGGAPTGIVFNNSTNASDFTVAENGTSGASVFIFAT